MENLEERDNTDWNLLWLGVDARGQIAAFQSLGYGAVPQSILTSIENAELVDQFIDTELLKTAGYCSGRLCAESETYSWRARFPSEKYSKDWEVYAKGAKRVASCGVFVYYPQQMQSQQTGYYQAAYPSLPLTIDTIPERIRDIVANIMFSELVFQSTFIIPASVISVL